MEKVHGGLGVVFTCDILHIRTIYAIHIILELSA